MKLVHLSSAVLCITGTAFLAACAGNGASPNSPSGAMPQGIAALNDRAPAPQVQATGAGLYVAEQLLTKNNILGFPASNRKNAAPICTLSTGAQLGYHDSLGDIDTDGKGDLIVPNGALGIDVYAPPPRRGACGKHLGRIADSYGQASSAAALDAVHGKIVVGNYGGGPTTGVVTCTLSSRSCTPLKSPDMATGVGSEADAFIVWGVAMDKLGNCYASAKNVGKLEGGTTEFFSVLYAYRRCTGKGRYVDYGHGFVSQGNGGLSIDNDGNLILPLSANFDSAKSTDVYVFSASSCLNGLCQEIGDPVHLTGVAYSFGHLSIQGNRWVSPGFGSSTVDVYAYRPPRSPYDNNWLTLLYSFDNGLNCVADSCSSAVFAQSSPE